MKCLIQKARFSAISEFTLIDIDRNTFVDSYLLEHNLRVEDPKFNNVWRNLSGFYEDLEERGDAIYTNNLRHDDIQFFLRTHFPDVTYKDIAASELTYPSPHNSLYFLNLQTFQSLIIGKYQSTPKEAYLVTGITAAAMGRHLKINNIL